MSRHATQQSARDRWQDRYDRGAGPGGRLHHAERHDRGAGVRRRTSRSGRASSRSPAASTRPATAGRTWTIRQFAGFGNAQQTNERYQMILGRGGGGLSVAFDMPTLMGRDSDDPQVPRRGRPLRRGDRLARPTWRCSSTASRSATVTTSMTISGPAVPVFCMYLVAAERAGRRHRRAQRHAADRHLQGVHRPEGVALRARAAPAPDRRPDGVLRREDPGVQAALGLRLPHPRGRLDGRAGARVHPGRRLRLRRARACRAASTSTSSRPGCRFFFDAHVDFFEEIAKFRAARRIWARWLRDVYGARTEKAQWLRFHTQTAGVSLTAQQPYNNVVRTGIEALAAVLGGTNSLHTNALDETLALPSEQAAEIALRTQQVIMEETGVVNVADPLGGSLVRRGADRPDRGRGQRDLRQDPRHGRLDPDARRHRRRSPLGRRVRRRADDPRHPARHRGRLVHVRDRRGRVPVPDRPREGREADRRRQLPRPSRSPTTWRSCGSPTRSRSSRCARWPSGRPAATSVAVPGGHRPDGRGRPDRREHDPGHARRRARRGDARRDLRRAARRVGRVPRAGALLTVRA